MKKESTIDHFVRTKDIQWKEIQKDVFEKECLLNKNGLNISILRIRPGKRIANHKHTDTRYNYILKGSMSDKHRTYKKGDLITNKKGSEHFLAAGPEGCEFILIWEK